MQAIVPRSPHGGLFSGDGASLTPKVLSSTLGSTRDSRIQLGGKTWEASYPARILPFPGGYWQESRAQKAAQPVAGILRQKSQAWLLLGLWAQTGFSKVRQWEAVAGQVWRDSSLPC